MSRFKKILTALAILFTVIQFIQPARNINGQVLATDITKVATVPDSVQMILKKACYDCHSNNTKYPFYAYIQPIGWLLNNHIVEGKKNLNFSEFGSLSKRRQTSKLKSIVDQVNDDAMPISQYTLIHRDAVLNKTEKNLIISWANSTRDSLSK